MKPDDIPQWAWDEAGRAIRASWREGNGAEQIARAILQARSQAFEECAKIADDENKECILVQDTEGANAAFNISQAIRQHSQKGEGK